MNGALIAYLKVVSKFCQYVSVWRVVAISGCSSVAELFLNDFDIYRLIQLGLACETVWRSEMSLV